jgi:hypothetical protein
VTILRTVLRELTTRIQNRDFCGLEYRLFLYANESARGPALGAHSHPITAEPACFASLESLDLATRYPANPVYQLIAWSCGRLHDQIEQNTRHILHAILALDPGAAAALGSCTELRQWDTEIDQAIQKLKAEK